MHREEVMVWFMLYCAFWCDRSNVPESQNKSCLDSKAPQFAYELQGAQLASSSWTQFCGNLVYQGATESSYWRPTYRCFQLLCFPVHVNLTFPGRLAHYFFLMLVSYLSARLLWPIYQ